MIINNQFFRKNLRIFLCATIVITFLMTGCTIDPVTGQSRLDPRFIGALGAVVGGVAGGFIGNKIGGTKGAAIGATLGAGAGGLAGYFISDYLNTREQQQYIANLNQQMKATPIGATGSNSWVNADRTKAVNTNYSQSVPLRQVLAQPDDRVPINKQRIASLPSNSTCRVVGSKFQVNGQQASIPSIYCRTANGDYIRVDGTAT